MDGTNMSEPTRLIGRKEAAAYLGIAESTFSLWVSTHKMPPPIFGTRKWDKRAIDAKLDDISGLATDRKEDRYEKWMREQGATEAGNGGDSLRVWRDKKAKRQAKHKPQMALDAKLERIVLFMAEHPECDTVASIPGAGPHFMDKLIDSGAVRLIGTERSTFRYALTEDGEEEVKRIRKWRSLAP
ncbi:hypothetical protein [Rhizobium sp. LCM 4573]|uniref:hypothetical protein n=1 Tax=Rhizobium sp. LCM 4573 TaxID=1848291 RepID=UPI00104230C7|nr:hypothetical protein [Rhizobium sp. LCM 4573]